MMGTQTPQKELFSYQVDLDKRIPVGHPLRQVKEGIDFSWARESVRGYYGYNGNKSVDPEIILKMIFLLFYDNVSSERELMRTIPYRMDYMWFLGYGLDEEIPNHSVLSKARARWGTEVFEELFVRMIQQCIEEGLVGGDKIHIDGSLICADASRDSVVKGGPELIEALKGLYRSETLKLEDEEERARKKYYEAQNKKMMSTTDPDAAIVSQKGIESRPRYKTHRIVDDVEGVITAVETTSGNIEENKKMMDVVEQHEKNTEREVKTIVADKQYGTTDNFRKCQERGIRAHMGDMQTKQLQKGPRKGIFHINRFVYDPETDTYICPAGQALKRRAQKKTRLVYEYACAMTICKACSMRTKCTKAKNGMPRTITRHYNQEAIDIGREQSHSKAAKKDRVRRKWLMEGSFADAANRHGFKRSRWRRLWRQQIQDYMIAAIQNIRILLARSTNKPGAASSTLVVRLKEAYSAALQCFWRFSRSPIVISRSNSMILKIY